MEEEQAADRCSTTGSADLLSVVVLLSSVVVLLSLVFVVEMTKNEQAGRRGWGLTLSFRLLFCFFFWRGEKTKESRVGCCCCTANALFFFLAWIPCSLLERRKGRTKQKNSSRFNRTTHGCFACQHSQFFLVFLASSFNTIPATGFIAAFKPGCA